MADWQTTTVTRSFVDRYKSITISATNSEGYVALSTDGSTWTYFAGPITTSPTNTNVKVLTLVANEAAAQAAPFDLTTQTRVNLPAIYEARYIKLVHRSKDTNPHILREFYPHRLVQADAIEAETVDAIVIKAASITADRMSVTQLSAIAADMGSITAGTITGGTIQTAASGARVVLSSAAYGGLIGYSGTDTYNPADGTGTYQVLWKKTDGKLYAGGGIVALDSGGITIAAGSSFADINAYKFTDLGGLYGYTLTGTDAYLRTYVSKTGYSSHSYTEASATGTKSADATLAAYAAGGTARVDTASTPTATSVTLSATTIKAIGNFCVGNQTTRYFSDDGTYTRFSSDFAVDGGLYASTYRASLIDMSGTGSGTATSIELGSAATGNRYAYIDLHGDDTYTDYGLRLIRYNGGANTTSAIEHRGTGYLQINAYDAGAIQLATANTVRWTVNSSGHLIPTGGGSLNIGDSSNYANEINYKTLTDRGCVPHQDRWEMPGGQQMTNLEVLAALRPHPTDKTIHGATKLDYASVPVLAQRPAPIATEDIYEDIVIEEADPKRGKDRVTEKRLKWKKGEKMGEDGVEMTLMFGVAFGAIRELRSELADLRARIKE